MSSGSTSEHRRWIVGVDGSDCSQHAARWALQNAPGRASSIRLTSAWSIPNAPALPPIGAMEKYWDIDSFERCARDSTSELAESLRRVSDTPIETSIVQGQSSSVLLSEAREASLLVVGSRGRGGFSRLVMGSTSTQCATHALTPTAVIPATASLADAQHVVVAVDGSENSLAALGWAIDFAAPDTTVECVGVWDVTPIAVGADQFFFPEAGELAHERFDHQIDSIVAAAAQRSADAVSVTRRFVDGRPRQTLEAAADDAHLLVMGARGHGAIGAAVLGSVSTWLLHHVRTPMVVVPQSSDVGFIDGIPSDQN